MASNSNGQGSSMHKVVEAEMKKPCNDQDQINKLKAEEDEVYRKLWLACAGPLANVPRVGDRVFYFPQGHIEQVEACTSKDIDVPMPIYNVPYKILCCVVSMQLQAEPRGKGNILTDAIGSSHYKDGESSQHQTAPSIAWESCIRSFSKKLTPSNTSTHGGLQVPRKCANECFPPLDMFQNLPAQDLIAKDLHETEWAFHHIYRGQPKRHLLSSGWSSFVNSKKLVAGDSCIFFRGKTSKLFVGIRRAIKPETNTLASLLSSQSIQHGVLAGAFHAISTGSLFNVYYYPWKRPAEFIIPTINT
ncbi:Auxin response factor 2 [Abeliophyllum distichum]|uniref:Auxin response factor 2 n=1 Tax=Abeliophyllum distichum TaxID=126358 RepID=A0ABD1RBP9_9LAMI